MQAGSNVLGRWVTAENMTLQNLGQVVSGHVSEIPAGEIQHRTYVNMSRQRIACTLQQTHAFLKDQNKQWAIK